MEQFRRICLENEDMVRINLKTSCHHLKIDSQANPHRQKRRALNQERYKALKDEVHKLIANQFIMKADYLKWVSNPILVKKHRRK